MATGVSESMTKTRPYICTDCGEQVTATYSPHNEYPGLFYISCTVDCTTVDSAPYEMGQAETPDQWRVKRPICCRETDVSTLEVDYGDSVADYRCPECGATYKHDGSLSEPPTDSPDDPTETDDNQRELTEL